ncbi:hypothetical protein TRIUR3_14540 [Triticum urartu]|nr:hypothetical protein TRIUR3_14540 [Triticum urartu]VAI18597.1 unnamed protein product [Triticum turgidum subsp. durum]
MALLIEVSCPLYCITEAVEREGMHSRPQRWFPICAAARGSCRAGTARQACRPATPPTGGGEHGGGGPVGRGRPGRRGAAIRGEGRGRGGDHRLHARVDRRRARRQRYQHRHQQGRARGRRGRGGPDAEAVDQGRHGACGRLANLQAWRHDRAQKKVSAAPNGRLNGMGGISKSSWRP